MVAILNNQVICITMIARSMPLHEFSNLNGVQACGPNEYGPPELEAWALPWLDLKNPTCWVVMGSKCIFYSMNFHTRVKDAEACPIGVAIHWCQVIHIEINRCIAWTITS